MIHDMETNSSDTDPASDNRTDKQIPLQIRKHGKFTARNQSIH